MDWDVFICHASEDKETFVRPLANVLEAKGLNVWYDEFTLKVGESLRESIDYGLSNSKFGIVVLSNNFFKKKWPTLELNGLFQKEETSGQLILPVWHNVTKTEVARYSPILADRIGILTKDGLEHVVLKLMEVIKGLTFSDLKVSRLSANLTKVASELEQKYNDLEILQKRIRELEVKIEKHERKDKRNEELNNKLLELESNRPKISQLEADRSQLLEELKKISRQLVSYVFGKSKPFSFNLKSEGDVSRFFENWYSQNGKLSIYCRDLKWLEVKDFEKVVKALRSKGENLSLYLMDTNDPLTVYLAAHRVTIRRIKPEINSRHRFSILEDEGKNSMLIRNSRIEKDKIIFEEYKDGNPLVDLAIDMLDECWDRNLDRT